MAAALALARRTWRRMSEDQVGDMAASLSYRFVLALFPLFIFIAAVGGLVAPLIGVADPASMILQRVAGSLPDDARGLLTAQLTQVLAAHHAGLASVAILGTIWAAGGGVSATMRAMNRAYHVRETRPWWQRTGLALGLTAGGGLLLIAALALGIAGEAIGASVADALGAQGAFAVLVTVLRLLLPVLLLTVATAVLFWAAPDGPLPFRWITPGAVLFIVTWIGGTAAFRLYVSRFGSYNATYGALGGLVILMVWLYLTAYMLLAGAEVNAALAEARGDDARGSDARGSDEPTANAGRDRPTASPRDRGGAPPGAERAAIARPPAG